jgi:hypothetical protein
MARFFSVLSITRDHLPFHLAIFNSINGTCSPGIQIFDGVTLFRVVFLFVVLPVFSVYLYCDGV